MGTWGEMWHRMMVGSLRGAVERPTVSLKCGSHIDAVKWLAVY